MKSSFSFPVTLGDSLTCSKLSYLPVEHHQGGSRMTQPHRGTQVPRLPPEWLWECHSTSLGLLGCLQEAGQLVLIYLKERAGPGHLPGCQALDTPAFLPTEGLYLWCGSAWRELLPTSW